MPVATLQRLCDECGQPFKGRRADAHFCTDACYSKNWRRRNPEKARATRARRYVCHREEIKTAVNAYYWRDPERARLAKKIERIEHPERFQAQDDKYRSSGQAQRAAAEWYARNAEGERERTKLWRAAHPEEVYQMGRQRRARKMAVVSVPYSRTTIYQRDQGICQICRMPVGQKWHIDHIVPLSRGASDTPENVQLAHPHCNQVKYRNLVPGGKMA